MSSLQILARKRVNLVNTGSGTDMSPLRCQVITGTNDELSSTAPRKKKKNELSTILTKRLKFISRRFIWQCRLESISNFAQTSKY